jgi:hypothetical protein
MKLNENAYVIEKMVKLINFQKTGNPIEFSKQLGISKSHLYEVIGEFRSLDVDIHFVRKQNTFVINGNKRIIVNVPIQIVDDDELTQLNGGFLQKYPSVLFSGRNELNLAVENSHE